jgi:hypothetical protein
VRAGRREKEPVGPRQCRTTGWSPQDDEFVPKRDDFQLSVLAPLSGDTAIRVPILRIAVPLTCPA